MVLDSTPKNFLFLGRTARLTSGSQCHFSLPVPASTANTMLQLVTPKMVLFQTSGVAS